MEDFMGVRIEQFRQFAHEARIQYKQNDKTGAAKTLAKGVVGLFWGKFTTKPRRVITVETFNSDGRTRTTETLTSALSVGKNKQGEDKNQLTSDFWETAAREDLTQRLGNDDYYSDTPTVKHQRTVEVASPVNKRVHISKQSEGSDGELDRVAEYAVSERTHFGPRQQIKPVSDRIDNMIDTLRNEGPEAFEEELSSWSDPYDLFDLSNQLAEKDLFNEDIEEIWNPVFAKTLSEAVVSNIIKNAVRNSPDLKTFQGTLHLAKREGVSTEQIIPVLETIMQRVLYGDEELSESQEEDLETATQVVLRSIQGGVLQQVDSNDQNNHLQQAINAELQENIEDARVVFEFEQAEIKHSKQRKEAADIREQKIKEANEAWGVTQKKPVRAKRKRRH